MSLIVLYVVHLYIFVIEHKLYILTFVSQMKNNLDIGITQGAILGPLFF